MSEIMMALGSYRFALSTAAYDKLERINPYRWAEQARHDREPSLQYIGPGKETVDLDGVIYPHFKGGLNQVQAMRDEAGRGEPLLLVDGLGNVWGQYVIEEIADRVSVFLPGGIPRKIEFSLKLAKYGEDAPK